MCPFLCPNGTHATGTFSHARSHLRTWEALAHWFLLDWFIGSFGYWWQWWQCILSIKSQSHMYPMVWDWYYCKLALVMPHCMDWDCHMDWIRIGLANSIGSHWHIGLGLALDWHIGSHWCIGTLNQLDWFILVLAHCTMYHDSLVHFGSGLVAWAQLTHDRWVCITIANRTRKPDEHLHAYGAVLAQLTLHVATHKPLTGFAMN